MKANTTKLLFKLLLFTNIQPWPHLPGQSVHCTHPAHACAGSDIAMTFFTALFSNISSQIAFVKDCLYSPHHKPCLIFSSQLNSLSLAFWPNY